MLAAAPGNDNTHIRHHMSLKKEIALIVLAAIVLFAALGYTFWQLGVVPTYREMDRARARADLGLTVKLLQQQVTNLDRLAQSWALRAETSGLGGSSSRQAGHNHPDLAAFRINHLNAAFLLTPDGRVLWTRSYGRDSISPLSMPELPPDRFPPASPFLQPSPAGIHGVLLTSRGPMLIACRPVFKAGGTGGPAGRLVLGRFLNLSDLAAIEEQTGRQLVVWRFPQRGAEEYQRTVAETGPEAGFLSGIAPEKKDLRAIARLAAAGVALQEGEGDNLYAYAAYPDIIGPGAMILRSQSEMSLAGYGRKALPVLLLSLMGAGLLILILLFVVLEVSVLKPISLLTAHAVSLRQNESDSRQIAGTVKAEGEFGALAREFDSMVAQLSLARRRLAAQSFHSGMTEMAAGVIHTLRNALTPVTANLDLLRDDCRDLPLAQMMLAVTELTDGAGDKVRRDMLFRYLHDSLQYLAEVMGDVQLRLQGMDHGVGKVENILSDREKFIAVNRNAEAVDLYQVIMEAIDVLGLQQTREPGIRLDDALKDLAPVQGQRTALLQIFLSLISNGVDAILRTGRSDGCIEIEVAPVTAGEPDLMHILVRDNGCGIAPENLPDIFKDGYSTKVNAGSGIGLHSCANSIAAMHGLIRAESGGDGQGTTIHLLLPKNKDLDNGEKES